MGSGIGKAREATWRRRRIIDDYGLVTAGDHETVLLAQLFEIGAPAAMT